MFEHALDRAPAPAAGWYACAAYARPAQHCPLLTLAERMLLYFRLDLPLPKVYKSRHMQIQTVAGIHQPQPQACSGRKYQGCSMPAGVTTPFRCTVLLGCSAVLGMPNLHHCMTTDLPRAAPAHMVASDSEGVAHVHKQGALLCQLRFVPNGLACTALSAWLPCSRSVGLHASSRPSLPQLPEQWVARVQLGPSIKSRQPSCLIGLPGHQQGRGKPLGQSRARSA